MASPHDIPDNNDHSGGNRQDVGADTGEFVVDLPKRTEGLKQAFASAEAYEDMVNQSRLLDQKRTSTKLAVALMLSIGLLMGGEVTGITKAVRRTITDVTGYDFMEPDMRPSRPVHPVIKKGP